jgi:hypothetical protein
VAARAGFESRAQTQAGRRFAGGCSWRADPKLPVNLSPKAIAEGWRGLAYSAPENVPADSLARGLRDYVYGGVSVWWLFGRPMLNSLAVLMLLYVLRLQMKQGLGRRRSVLSLA